MEAIQIIITEIFNILFTSPENVDSAFIIAGAMVTIGGGKGRINGNVRYEGDSDNEVLEIKNVVTSFDIGTQDSELVINGNIVTDNLKTGFCEIAKGYVSINGDIKCIVGDNGTGGVLTIDDSCKLKVYGDIVANDIDTERTFVSNNGFFEHSNGIIKAPLVGAGFTLVQTSANGVTKLRNSHLVIDPAVTAKTIDTAGSGVVVVMGNVLTNKDKEVASNVIGGDIVVNTNILD